MCSKVKPPNRSVNTSGCDEPDNTAFSIPAPCLLFLQVVTFYNQLHEVEEKKPCKHFELDVTIEESSGMILFFPKRKYEYEGNIHANISLFRFDLKLDIWYIKVSVDA